MKGQKLGLQEVDGKRVKVFIRICKLIGRCDGCILRPRPANWSLGA